MPKNTPNAHLIARQFKEDLLSGRSTAAHHFDPLYRDFREN